MPLDSQIFGAGAPVQQTRDADIFKDLPAPKESVAEETKPEATKPPKTFLGFRITPTPEQHAAFQDAMNRGFGTGVPKLMYDVGGRVTDATGSPLIGTAVNMVPDVLQTILSGNVAGAVGNPLAQAAARPLMRSALKPTLDQVRKGRAAPAVETMLTDGEGGLFSMPGYNPTAAGVEKMKGVLSDLGDQVQQAISNSGARINTGAVADYVADAYKRFANGPLATGALEALGKVQQEFLEHPNVNGAKDIAVQVAQDMKRGYQRAVGDKAFGELKTPATEGEKQIARGLREEIAQAVPSVVDPLARESSIINAAKMAERRVAVDANKNPIGLGWLGQPWMLPFWLWDRSAAAKALTARALANGEYPALAGAAGGALYQQQ